MPFNGIPSSFNASSLPFNASLPPVMHPVILKQIFFTYPANTTNQSDVEPMLAYRLRRWPNIGPRLDRCVGFAGYLHCLLKFLQDSIKAFPATFNAFASLFNASLSPLHAFTSSLNAFLSPFNAF